MSFKSNLAIKGARYNRRGSEENGSNKEKFLDKLQQLPRSADPAAATGAASPAVNPLLPLTPAAYIEGEDAATTTALSVAAGSASEKGVAAASNSVSNSSSNSSGGHGSLLSNKSFTKATTATSAAVDSKKQYWQEAGSAAACSAGGDVVIIHVCDENQNISRDFCCKRSILVQHMKYFERFLADNSNNSSDNSYDDIDISVHCDVEIFEWLMTYIHSSESDSRNILIDKSIIVSILISSEFLQMDALVELCVQQVSANLNDIIKLPIDLSCISEKLINRIAFLTHPKKLSETRDRKDKILTKLYKRRVELDFSRKGSALRAATAATAGGALSITAAATATANRTIAASLTCCRHCGSVYLENYVNFLSCKQSPPTVDFRGQLNSRHAAVVGWSLTSYLKTLHSGGMGWDAIYWHVWAACVVLRPQQQQQQQQQVVISALEVDRYTVEPDGLLIRASVLKEREMNSDEESHGESDGHTTLSAASAASNNSSSSNGSSSAVLSSIMGSNALPPRALAAFSLSTEDDCCRNYSNNNSNSGSSARDPVSFKLLLHRGADHWNTAAAAGGHFQCSTSSLNPNRPPDVLTAEIYDLICTQMKFIVGLSHKDLIQRTMKSIIDSAQSAASHNRSNNSSSGDIGEALWGLSSAAAGDNGRIYNSLLSAISNSHNNSNNNSGDSGSDGERRRGRSPARATRGSFDGRKQNSAASKGRATSASTSAATAVTGGNNSSSGGGVGIADNESDAGAAALSNNSIGLNASQDSDQDASGSSSHGTRPPLNSERRSRSHSSANRAAFASKAAALSASTGSSTNAATASSSNGGNVTSSGTSRAAKKAAVRSSVDDQGFSYQRGAAAATVAVNSRVAKQIAVLKSVPPEIRHRINNSSGNNNNYNSNYNYSSDSSYCCSPVNGVWLGSHPLQLQSLAHVEMLNLVGDNSSLPLHKKLEWELDIMREFDEKRMERFAVFLSARRAAALDAQFDARKISQQFRVGPTSAVTATATGASTNGFNATGTTTSSGTAAAGGASKTGRSGAALTKSSAVEYYRDKGRQPK